MNGRVGAITLALLMASCGSDDPEERGPDAGTDASSDAEADVEGDSGSDGDGDDTGEDGVADTTGDAGPDPDTRPDADSSADGSGDTTVEPCAAACADLGERSADDCGADAVAAYVAACGGLCGTSAEDVVVAAAAVDGSAVPDESVQIVAWLAGMGATCDLAGCGLASGLYTPDVGGIDWAGEACVSDGGEFVQIGESVSSIGRVAAYEQIADLTWRAVGTPSADDFIEARTYYAADEGIDSRVQRREDEHYPPAVDGDGNAASCRTAGIPELNPDRCAGPALILPIVNQAFQDGINGVEPRMAAARLQAALDWFFYISSYKESRTCATTAADCDSAWAYYSGGTQAGDTIGLGGVYRAASPEANEAVFDGLLAVRCWRDIDSDPAATDADLQNRATEQLDQALHFGLSRVILSRLADYQASAGDEQAEHRAYLDIIGPVLTRELVARNADDGAAYAELWAAETLDVEAIARLLLANFPCAY